MVVGIRYSSKQIKYTGFFSKYIIFNYILIAPDQTLKFGIDARLIILNDNDMY